MNWLEILKQNLRFKIWAKYKANIYPSFYYSHSQFGEDMVVRHLTDGKTQGFYVDIGAFHPVYLSNTYHFYCKGWQGINIDGRPKSMELFQVLRPKDINLEICLSSEEKDVTFFSFEQSPYDTINPSVAEEVINEKKIKLLNKFSMKSRTLESVLEEYLPDGKKIDLMNIDVEGIDEEILMSNNWQKFKPRIIIFEKHNVSFREALDSSIVVFLEKIGYELVTKVRFSLIMINQDY